MVVAKGADRTSPARALAAASIAAFLSLDAGAQATAAEADSVKATGAFPITTQTSLVVRGVPGKVLVTVKPAQELRFTSRATDKSGSERAIAVRLGERTFTLEPPPGVTLPEGILRVEAPASFSVRVEAQGGTVLVDGFAGAVAIVGRESVVRAQGLRGSLDADIAGGSLGLSDLGGMATARLGAASKLTATNLRGGLDLRSEDATFKVQGVAGACRLEARGGSGELAGLAAGGDLRLSESTLRLTGGHGDMRITSNAAVQFSNMAAPMRFEMDGGSVQGKGNQGSIEVRGRRTDVSLEAIEGAVHVEGEGLKTKLVGISGTLNLDVSRGNVVVQRASGVVTAVLFAGDAQFSELRSAVHLDIEGGNAELSWAAVTGDKDTVLANRGGDITVLLPAGASCRVAAKSTSGRITSDIASLKVPADATEAQGTMGQGPGPLIGIEAHGNIRLSVTPGAPAPPS